MKRIITLILVPVIILGIAAYTVVQTLAPTLEPIQEVVAPPTSKPSEPAQDAAEAPAPEPTQDAAPTPEPIEEAEPVAIYGAIHRIEYGDNVVYLFGSIPGGRGGWFPLADVVEDAMNRADVFVSEIGNIDPMEQAERIMEYTMLPNRQTWAEFFPADVYESLTAAAEAIGMPYEQISTMNPLTILRAIELELAQTLVEDAMLRSSLGSLIVDGYIMARAVERGVPILALESVEQQARILNQPPFEVMVFRAMQWQAPDVILSRIANNPEFDLTLMVNLYETNDSAVSAALWAAHLSPEATGDDLWLDYMRETVMNGRSIYYANEIARLLTETEESTTFFVVVGKSHIIRSMAGEGFTDIVAQLGLLGLEAVPIWE